MMQLVRTIPLVAAALITQCSAPPASNAPELAIPAIGLSRVVVVGGQQEIDAGNVVNYGDESDGGCWPGEDCTVWLAGHRTSHGSVFRNVPRLAAGDELVLHYRGSTFTYVVTDRSIVDRADPPPDFMHGDLMIQTSWTHGQVLLVYAVAV